MQKVISERTDDHVSDGVAHNGFGSQRQKARLRILHEDLFIDFEVGGIVVLSPLQIPTGTPWSGPR
jgi:hypothetical protein